MDRTRKKLIEELIRIGRLIDPAPCTGQRKGEDTAKLSGIPKQSDMDSGSPVEDLEDLPVVDDVVDRPYTTKDMFTDPSGSRESRIARTLEAQQLPANTSRSGNASVTKRADSTTIDPEQLFSEETTGIEFPIEELARELVTLIEDRVNQRSGEQLDDTFREELTQAVIAQLESWLK